MSAVALAKEDAPLREMLMLSGRGSRGGAEGAEVYNAVLFVLLDNSLTIVGERFDRLVFALAARLSDNVRYLKQLEFVMKTHSPLSPGRDFNYGIRGRRGTYNDGILTTKPRGQKSLQRWNV